MVREIRVPSSSSSNSTMVSGNSIRVDGPSLTDGDGLYPDTLLGMRVGRVVGILMVEDLLTTEGVDEGGSAWRGIDMLFGCSQASGEA